MKRRLKTAIRVFGEKVPNVYGRKRLVKAVDFENYIVRENNIQLNTKNSQSSVHSGVQFLPCTAYSSSKSTRHYKRGGGLSE